jgi:hypothetical protein
MLRPTHLKAEAEFIWLNLALVQPRIQRLTGADKDLIYSSLQVPQMSAKGISLLPIFRTIVRNHS